MKERYTIKNPGKENGYRLPLLSDEQLRIQRTPYGDAAFGTLPDVIGKMEDMMKLDNWKEMLAMPAGLWPAYIKENRSV